MFVSVIIRTYNRGYIIADAIDSALNQTYTNFEIVVVDDGSTDNTDRIVAQYKNPKVRYVRHPKNRGVAVAGNTGIKESLGTVIALLDSDDLWKPHKLERQIAVLESHLDVDVVFSDVELHDGGRRFSSTMGFMHRFPEIIASQPEQQTYILGAREMYLCLLQEVPIKTNSVIMRRSALDQTGYFDESSKSGEDWELFLRLARSAGFAYIKEPLAIQRRLSDSTHDKFKVQDKAFLLDRFLSEKLRVTNDPEALAAVRRGISGHYNNLGYHYLFSRQRRQAVSAYWNAFQETGERMFLVRAAAVCLPLDLRTALKSLVRGDEPDTRTDGPNPNVSPL